MGKDAKAKLEAKDKEMQARGAAISDAASKAVSAAKDEAEKAKAEAKKDVDSKLSVAEKKDKVIAGMTAALSGLEKDMVQLKSQMESMMTRISTATAEAKAAARQ